MKMKRSNKSALSLFLCMVLVVAMTLFTTGCSGNTESKNHTTQETEVNTSENTDTSSDDSSEGNSSEENSVSVDTTVLGEGEKQFLFTVVDGDGNETAFEIHTDKETVGEALLELELISGEDGDYGLYVKAVNGIAADYDKDGTYWAFYVNGEYAASGVDTTAITEGDSYSFKVEK